MGTAAEKQKLRIEDGLPRQRRGARSIPCGGGLRAEEEPEQPHWRFAVGELPTN